MPFAEGQDLVTRERRPDRVDPGPLLLGSDVTGGKAVFRTRSELLTVTVSPSEGLNQVTRRLGAPPPTQYISTLLLIATLSLFFLGGEGVLRFQTWGKSVVVLGLPWERLCQVTRPLCDP